MAAAYRTDSREIRCQDRSITVVNLTPEYHREERKAVKKEIEEQLFEIFCQYMPGKT